MDYLHYKVEEGQVSALKNTTPSHIRYLAEEEFINTVLLIHTPHNNNYKVNLDNPFCIEEGNVLRSRLVKKKTRNKEGASKVHFSNDFHIVIDVLNENCEGPLQILTS